MGKSVIFVAHEREEKNGEEKQIRPEIGGSSAGDLIKELDLVGYMELSERSVPFLQSLREVLRKEHLQSS